MPQIPTADHKHNADPSANLVWEDRMRGGAVYRVRAGYVVTFGNEFADARTFSTQADATAAFANTVGDLE